MVHSQVVQDFLLLKQNVSQNQYSVVEKCFIMFLLQWFMFPKCTKEKHLEVYKYQEPYNCSKNLIEIHYSGSATGFPWGATNATLVTD